MFRMTNIKNVPKGLNYPIKDDTGEYTGEFANYDPSKPSIKITNIRIDQSSHSFNSAKDYVGLIVYLKDGKSEFTWNKVNYQTGDIFIKESEWLLKNIRGRDKRGKYVHGRLFHSIFGCWKEKKLGFVIGGFSYCKGEWKYNSGTLNTMNRNNNDDGYHNTNRKLDEFEEKVIRNVCDNLYVNNQWCQIPAELRIPLKDLLDPKRVNDFCNKEKGTVKWVNYRQGYAFIECDDFADDIFVHCSAVLDRRMSQPFLKRGDNVQFNVIEEQKGWQAENVTIDEDD